MYPEIVSIAMLSNEQMENEKNQLKHFNQKRLYTSDVCRRRLL